MKVEVPVILRTGPETVNKYDFCYHYSIDGPELFFGDSIIRYNKYQILLI